MAGESKEKSDTWIPLTPEEPVSGCEFWRYGSVNSSDGSVSDTVAPDSAKTTSSCSKGVARKVGFEPSGSHGKSESLIDILKKRSTEGTVRKPRKSMRMKRHRPKVFDETKPVKPSTPKPRTPKPARYAKKKVNPSKDSKRPCKRKLDFNKESCIVDQKNLIPEDGISNVEPKRRSSSRLASLRIHQTEESPRIFKKRRKMRRRVSPHMLFKLDQMIREKFLRIPTSFNKGRRSMTRTPRRNLSSFFGAHEKVQEEGVEHVAAKKDQEEGVEHVAAKKDQEEGVEHVAAKDSVEHLNLTGMKLSSFLAADDEVKDDGAEHVAAKKSVEHGKTPRDDTDSCNRDMQNCSPEFENCTCGAEMEMSLHGSEFCMSSNTTFRQQEDIMSEYMDLSNEEKSVLLMQGYDAFTDALVDFASQKMESLYIDDGSKQLVVRDQDGHGAVLPSKGKIDPSKSYKRRIHLDLDPATTRLWDLMNDLDAETLNMLIENKGCEDNDKAYWEQQRELFGGRVDSFIALMHLVLGDRRFLPWKGSVVDSIVGVFLTQNVSDNLSSSAFMALAARYPPLSVSKQNVILETQQAKVPTLPSVKCTEESNPSNQVEVYLNNGNETSSTTTATTRRKKGKVKDEQENKTNWDELRKNFSRGISRNRTEENADSVNWEAVRQAPVEELAKVIVDRGMNNTIARRIKDFLDRLVRDHGSIDLEWLRVVPPDKGKKYLMSIDGLGLKSTECVRLLSLHQRAFPIDTNAGRAVARLGWVPLTLPEGVPIHLLNEYPDLGDIQKYIWPRICHHDQLTLYELHCHLIAFSKAFCTKSRPNCSACPLKGECRHYASAVASSRLSLEGSRAKDMTSESSAASSQEATVNRSPPMLTNSDGDASGVGHDSLNSEPIVEFPASPEHAAAEPLEGDIEDFGCEPEIPIIMLNSKELDENEDISKALVALSAEVASIPMPKLKDVVRLRTVHHVYELPDSHPLLAGFEKREPDDPCPYLLAIWTTDKTTDSPRGCNCQESTTCDEGACFSGEIVQYQKDQKVEGTILIPCRTANRGRFPLNGTYFQINEVFADHESSRRPIDVPRESIWDLRRRALYCGTSITSICKGMSFEEIAYCFRKGYICIRGFDMETRGARPLARRFHVCKSRQPGKE